MSAAPRWDVGIDVGGTFTDLVALAGDGRRLSTKAASTADPSEGVLDVLQRAAAQLQLPLSAFLAQVGTLVHGTTVATNALLEYRGAKVGLITTEGFRDELEFRRSYKESTFDPRLPPPPPICPRRYRIGVPERLSHQGEVLVPLDEAAVRAALRMFRAEGVEAVAVCFLFSFVDDRHERRVAELIAQELPHAHVSLSCEVLPEIREFERVSTTVVNAYTGPLIAGYLQRLRERLAAAGFGGELLVMQSHGGVLGPQQSARLAVGTLLSGPAGGVTAAAWTGARAGYPNLLSVDMGGTSYDIALIEQLTPGTTTESWIGRYRIARPMLDIHTIGAGGGSLAWIDDGGALRVGPRSAGSLPGPACYGRGGEQPTVTDANLLLGYLNPDYFLGGEMRLDRAAAAEAVHRHIAGPLQMTVEEAALAIIEIVNHNLADASHFVTTQRGHDPQEFALLAVGGAGALHAGRQAQLLGIGTVIVPASGPVFCALGDTLANLQVSVSRSFHATLPGLDLAALNQAFDALEARARSLLGGAAGAAASEVRRRLDLRYQGEVHETQVALATRTRRITGLNLEAALRDFHALHERLYAHRDPAQPVELLTLRLDLIGLRQPPEQTPGRFGEEDPVSALKGQRRLLFASGAASVPVYAGDRLQPGHFIAGPAVIEQWGTTIVVYPRQEALIDAWGNCIIELAADAAGMVAA
ncbi:hydantoinase/oxoprolinase family protein [Xanthomonas bundabergensis]|uniref:hydantoinase/oxoprolinase family protein n=1 Tax=Xanthomonas bundabergensis TaxID=3160842 RepID=UPI0035130A19